MGVGKSTLARKIAKKINYQFIDTDVYIEKKFKTTVNNIISSLGIDAFRKIERDVLTEITQMSNCIVATGGGLPCFHNNMDVINANGFSIYLFYATDIIFYRLKNARTERPLIKEMNDAELREFITATLSEREVFYNRADCIIKERNLKTEHVLKPIFEFIAQGK